MIVQESDILLAALDRRLSVERVATLDPIVPLSRSSGSPQRPDMPTATAASSAGATATAETIAARLPLGQLVSARVVAVPQPDHVIADVDSLRIALAWPQGNGVAPRPGSDVRLRVLAHAPMLLFQGVVDERASPDEAAPRWSSDALRLQSGAAPGDPMDRATGTTRFDVPILEIDIVPNEGPSTPIAEEPAPRALPSMRTAGAHGPPAQIALDDIIVARGTALVDGIASPLIVRRPDDALPPTTPFVPLVLQGPAWPGQPMELVVRRERADDQFDNPALDSWCGELTIDLPHLGRVAGHLSFSMQGLRIRLEADETASVSAMTASATELAAAFAGVDIRVAALSVGQVGPDTTRSGSPRG